MSHLTLQLPDSVLERARRLAEREQVSLDQFVSRMIVQVVEADQAWEERVRRGRQVSRERVLAILDKVPDVPPMPGDEIE
jgi:hypothetical protein